VFIGIGAFMGLDQGLLGSLVAASIMAAFCLPFYLYGAYESAELSDYLESKCQK